MKKTGDNDIRTLDIILHEVGLASMEDGPSTPDDRRWADDFAASMRTRIAEYRRARSPSVPIKKAPPISQRLLAMSREALDALFGSLVERWGTNAQFAHRQLDTLSDNDLRRMIQTMEDHARRA